MSRNYWIAILAFGLALLLEGQGNAQEEQEQSEQSREAPQADQEPFSIPVRILEPEREEQTRQRREQEADQRQIEDLRAQQGMDESTRVMKWAAIWQTVFIFIGTIAVVWTLRLMVQANKAAIKAAEASEQAVRITRESYEAQLRAYLSFKFTQVEGSTEARPGRLVTTIKNHGNTPAFILQSVARYKLFKDGEASKIFFRDDPDQKLAAQGMVFPGEVEVLNLDAQLTSEVARVIREGGSIHVAGVLIYKDAFGVTRRTIFHTICDRVKRDGTLTFHPAGNHNTAS